LPHDAFGIVFFREKTGTAFKKSRRQGYYSHLSLRIHSQLSERLKIRFILIELNLRAVDAVNVY